MNAASLSQEAHEIDAEKSISKSVQSQFSVQLHNGKIIKEDYGSIGGYW